MYRKNFKSDLRYHIMKILKRESLLIKLRSHYDTYLIKILVGMRRCGKTTLMLQIMDELKEKGVSNNNIIHINFEIRKFKKLTDPDELYLYIVEQIKNNEKYYIFLDEIQRVDDFEDVINSIRVEINCSIFITGSNGKLLSSELKTGLTGRYIEFRIMPFSFKETVEYLGEKDNIEKLFFDYLKWGGLPHRFVYSSQIDVETYILDLYNSIILKDIVERYNIKNTSLLQKVVNYLMENSSKLFSPNKIVNYLKSNGINVSTETIYNYVSYILNSLIVEESKRFDTKGKKILSSSEKYYASDPSFKTINTSDVNTDVGQLIEIVVFNELISRGYSVFVGKTSKSEIDFIATKNSKKIYIQVTYYLYDEKIIKREFSPLEVIEDNYPKYVLSLDKIDMSRNGIVHLNLIDDFLLSGDF